MTSARQIFPPAAASRAKLTPPSRMVEVQPQTCMHTMSSLSTSNEAREASAALQSLSFNMDEFALSDSLDDGAPSPKKALPDFTLQKSDDDSVTSGDDSNGWEREEDRVRNAFNIQADTEDELELANFASDGPVNKVLEWTTLTNDLEMGNADDEVAALPEVVKLLRLETLFFRRQM